MDPLFPLKLGLNCGHSPLLNLLYPFGQSTVSHIHIESSGGSDSPLWPRITQKKPLFDNRHIIITSTDAENQFSCPIDRLMITIFRSQKIVVVAGRKRSDSLFFYCSPSSDRQYTIWILYRIDVWCLHIQIDNDTFCIVEIAIQLREDEWNQWNIQINIFDFWFVFDINKMIKWTKFCDWWKSENVDCSNIV